MRRSPRPRALAAAAILLAVACAPRAAQVPAPPPHPSERILPPTTFVYRCEEDYRFVAQAESGLIRLFLPDATRTLPQVRAASGAKYSDGAATFWSKGQDATLEIDGRAYRTCKNDAREALWEEAARRGVDFRAIGHEPGWYLEITEGNRIVLVTNYGTVRYEFDSPAAPAMAEQPKRAIYRALSEGREIIAVIEDRSCIDSMDGEKYEASVQVFVDSLALNGCGRRIHR